MKKVILTAVAVVALGSFGHSTEFSRLKNFDTSKTESALYADCFLYSIEYLEDVESDLGFELSLSHQVLMLNNIYESCECTQNGNCFI
ncbi:MAG: hypothetical protein KKC03_03150 [Bacteroidetes bacterium]|nr:hypothetical protein [Bacteroidota bacterium]